MEFKHINVNEKSQYISFMSPTLKNKKGHTRQLTKSIKNISQDEISKILNDTDELLGNYEQFSDNYEAFLKAIEKFHKKSIEWVFDKTDIISKYNQDSIIRTIETKISTRDNQNNYIFPAALLIGSSGSGKTTFIKQLIGSTDTNFPATMQSNTTVGSMIAVIKNDSNHLVVSTKLINKSALRDRLEQAYIQSVKQILRNEKKIADILYDNITIYDDKKVKLQYIVSKDDIDSPRLLSMLENESIDIWKSFLKVSSDLPFSVSEKFSENFSVELLAAFGEFIEENLEKSQVLDEVIEIIEDKVRNIVISFFDFLKTKEDIEFSIEIIDENNVVQLGDDKIFAYPKMITMSINYKSKQRPDKELRKIFFNALEHMSSANETSQGKTLFPLIEHLRIIGNFKPLWYGEDDLFNYILVDSEGIGHDITNQSVSMQMREIMSRCNLITVIQNGAEQMQTAFAETLRALIYNGWIDKAKFCFNRMESFDLQAHASVDSKLAFISSNIKNALKQIVCSEKCGEQRIVDSREDIFQKLILDKSLYFEYLRENFESREKFIPLEKKGDWNKINNMDIDESIKNTICEGLYVQLSDTNIFNPVQNINKYLKEVVRKRERFTLETIKLKNFNPQYRADVFSAILNRLNNTFVKEFLRQINISPWQTVKAFNARIAGNWDNREWSTLKPEALFIELANTVIMHYLLNPENKDEINERNGVEFTTIVQQIISEVISSFSNGQSINEIAKRTIYSDLLEECWKPGINELKGTGSTYRREVLINEKIMSKFYVDYDKGHRNFLYKEMITLVLDNDFTKALNATYR